MLIRALFQAVAGALRSAGLTKFSISVAEERVVVVTDRHQDQVKETIEQTGKLAVLIGASGGGGGGGGGRGVLSAAVAMLGVGGDYLSPGPKGVIRLTQLGGRGGGRGGGGGCVIEGTVDGLSPGLHGLAIHETGDTSQGCLSLGGHFNPQGSRHGSPDSQERHYGDLGNIMADQDGRARFRLVDKVVEVWDVIGTAGWISS